MNTSDIVNDTKFLGRDFMVWLWFRSERNSGFFHLENGEEIELWFDGSMILQSERDGRIETISCTGEQSRFLEARYALSEFKKIIKAKIKLIAGDNAWSFSIDDTWFNFRGMRLPHVTLDQHEDPDAIFYERIGLIEKAVSIMDRLFALYTTVRTSGEWENEEMPAIRKWITHNPINTIANKNDYPAP